MRRGPIDNHPCRLISGNEVRMRYFPPPPNLLKLTAVSLYYTAGFIAYTAYLAPLTTLMAVALPGTG